MSRRGEMDSSSKDSGSWKAATACITLACQLHTKTAVNLPDRLHTASMGLGCVASWLAGLLSRQIPTIPLPSRMTGSSKLHLHPHGVHLFSHPSQNDATSLQLRVRIQACSSGTTVTQVQPSCTEASVEHLAGLCGLPQTRTATAPG